MNDISIVDVKPQMVIGTSKRGKYEQIPALLQRLYQFSVEKGAQIQGPPVFICHETSIEEVMKADEEGTALVEVAFPIAGKVEGSNDIKYYELPGGKMVKAIHKGPYEECISTYEKLYAWLAQNGKKIIAPTREAYLNDPNQVPPEEILTEIYLPID
jgi:effector-binding domain-containing protein